MILCNANELQFLLILSVIYYETKCNVNKVYNIRFIHCHRLVQYVFVKHSYFFFKSMLNKIIFLRKDIVIYSILNFNFSFLLNLPK